MTTVPEINGGNVPVAVLLILSIVTHELGVSRIAGSRQHVKCTQPTASRRGRGRRINPAVATPAIWSMVLATSSKRLPSKQLSHVREVVLKKLRYSDENDGRKRLSRSSREGVTNMAQFMMSVWHDGTYEVDFSTPDAQRRVAKVAKLNEELQHAGVWRFAAGLQPSSSATVVRAMNGEVSMLDGPYAETKEQMGGFWMIDTIDLEAALVWAGKAALASEGPVEVRPAQG
jgi:hypothetical protein